MTSGVWFWIVVLTLGMVVLLRRVRGDVDRTRRIVGAVWTTTLILFSIIVGVSMPSSWVRTSTQIVFLGTAAVFLVVEVYRDFHVRSMRRESQPDSLS